jgi:hypothetical protein
MSNSHPIRAVSVTIGAGASLSTAVDLGGMVLTRILLPSGWDAADITFQESADNSTFYNLYNGSADTEYTIQGAASRSVIIPPADILGLAWLKVRSGTSGAAVNQVDAVTLTLIVRPLY